MTAAAVFGGVVVYVRPLRKNTSGSVLGVGSVFCVTRHDIIIISRGEVATSGQVDKWTE